MSAFRDEAQQLLLTQLSGLLGDTGAEGIRVMLGAADKGRELLKDALVVGSKQLKKASKAV